MRPYDHPAPVRSTLPFYVRPLDLSLGRVSLESGGGSDVENPFPSILSYQAAVAFIIGAAMAPNPRKNWWKWGAAAIPLVMVTGPLGLLAMGGASIGTRMTMGEYDS